MGAEGVGEVEDQDGQEDMSADSLGSFLGEDAQKPALFEFAKERVLDQAAQVIEVDDAQWGIHRQTGQEDDGFFMGIDFLVELGDDNGVDGIAFEISPVTLLLVLFIAILVIGGQTLDTDQLEMSALLFAFSGTFSGKKVFVVWFLFEKSPRIIGDLHIGFDRDHKTDAIFVLDLP